MHTKKPVAIAPWDMAWLLRPDLRRGEPASKPVPDWFRTWWEMEGRNAYPAWSDQHTLKWDRLLEPLPDWPHYGAFGMTPALHYLIERREDLAQVFDVSTEQGLWHAISWFYVHGIREHDLTSAVGPTILAALDATPPFFQTEPIQADIHPPLTWLMFFVWRCSGQLHALFDLRAPQGRAAFLEWFLLDGVSNMGLLPLVAPRWSTWLQQPMGLHRDARVGVPRAGCLLWQRRPDLQRAFDLRKEESLVALAAWTASAWLHEPGLRWVREAAAPVPAVAAELGQPLVRPFGLNLIGFAFGELGVGEDVRMAASACEAAGIPFAVVNIHPGEKLRQADNALADHVAATAKGEQAPYSINLFCLTGFDTVRVALERGPALFSGRKNIGWWPWELPVWPRDWFAVFGLIDEVWAATDFTRVMYAEAAAAASGTPPPVVRMPLPASVARVVPMTRQALGIPSDKFLFLYVFDFNSYLARKNPFAALKAFRKAFNTQDESVGLVLKTMNSNPQNPEWKRFVRACARDRRITVLDKTLDRGQVLGLIKSCNAYVSLHRSEGFGRTMAEAMLFGKPVVGTDFSGNVDFLSTETGFPVTWKRRVVQSGEYPFVSEADRAWWAEPDITHAARQMRAARAANNDGQFSMSTEEFANEIFSPRLIGLQMRERLDKISG
jgi:glycosyltransferase involved in cell wall biosynthesis